MSDDVGDGWEGRTIQGIDGYLWKFPSEGSNSSPASLSLDNESATRINDDRYPRKCTKCHTAWVSSFTNERSHWRKCSVDSNLSTMTDTSTMPKLGIAHRVWCEVDAAVTCLQWRVDPQAAVLPTCSIGFHEMTQISMINEPHNSFQILTADGRRVVFQYRASVTTSVSGQQATSDHVEVDARQWCEYLQTLWQFTIDQEVQTNNEIADVSTPSKPANKSAEIHDYGLLFPFESNVVPRLPESSYQLDLCNEDTTLWNEITRMIVKNDIDELRDLFIVEKDRGCHTLVDENGNSLLMLAVKLGAHISLLEVLVMAGVDCNAKNHDGDSILLLAAASGDLELVKFLIHTPTISLNQRHALGATALHAAANAGEVQILTLLCDSGASTTKMDENGWTALHYAAACPEGTDALHFLCELLPEVIDQQCIQGNTALHVAAGYGCLGNVRSLLETAANPHIFNGDGHTPYHVALHNNHIACAMAVHEYMDSPNASYTQSGCSRVDTNEDIGLAVELSLSHCRSHYKEDELSQAELPHNAELNNSNIEWMECTTEHGVPYYYNHTTGASTWHRPEILDFVTTAPPPAPFRALTEWVHDEDESASENGHKLPLCMIPLVSPLVSLDDPTAATKFDSRRRREREKRRSKSFKRRTDSDR